jgi:hypothetical protein
MSSGPYLLVGFLRVRALTRGRRQAGSRPRSAARPIAPIRVMGPVGKIPLAVVTRSPVVCRRTVKLMRSMFGPGRAVAVSPAMRINAW